MGFRYRAVRDADLESYFDYKQIRRIHEGDVVYALSVYGDGRWNCKYLSVGKGKVPAGTWIVHPADLEFLPSVAKQLKWEEIQVDWIASCGRVHNLDHVLPWKQASLIRCLGNPDYDCRAVAWDDLEEMGQGAFTALCWGTRNRDPEIRFRCIKLINRLYLCTRCNGLGKVRMSNGKEVGWDEECEVYYNDCPECTGSGDLRWHVKTEWTFDGQKKEILPVDFFK